MLPVNLNVVVIGCDEDASRQERIAVPGQPYVQGRATVQPAGQAGCEAVGDVLDDQEGYREVRRESTQK
jgi:hypothetical protein